MFFKIGVLQHFKKFTGKHLRWGLFLMKLQAYSKPEALSKKRPRHKRFPVNFVKCWRTPLFIEHPRATASDTNINKSNENLIKSLKNACEKFLLSSVNRFAHKEPL